MKTCVVRVVVNRCFSESRNHACRDGGVYYCAMPSTYKTMDCFYPGCEVSHTRSGFCLPHWKAWREHSTPLVRYVQRAAEERFFESVEFTDTCWLWTGKLDSNGKYGDFRTGGRATKHWRAHRWAYEYLVGPIPEGMHLDHICCVTLCLNPDHLDVVTLQENIRRAAERRTTCRRGHPHATYSKTYQNGRRFCVACAMKSV